MLEDIGLVEKVDCGFKGTVRIFSYRNKFIITDFPSLLEIDRVFPTDEEGPGYLIDNLNIKNGDVVLDLGTGSGIFAIFCADKAKKVIATDINPKALDYARFNAVLNNVENKIEFLCGDLFESIEKERFDFIVSNPPPVPVPPNMPFYIHSDGGPNGIDVFKRMLERILNYATPDKRMQFIMLSLEKQPNPLIIDILKLCLEKAKVKISLFPLYPQRSPIEPDFLALFEKAENFPKWKTNLKREGFIWLDCFFIDIRSDSKFQIIINSRLQNQSSYNWRKRMAKYVLPVYTDKIV
jgi:HemK-related putative methylase